MADPNVLRAREYVLQKTPVPQANWHQRNPAHICAAIQSRPVQPAEAACGAEASQPSGCPAYEFRLCIKQERATHGTVYLSGPIALLHDLGARPGDLVRLSELPDGRVVVEPVAPQPQPVTVHLKKYTLGSKTREVRISSASIGLLLGKEAAAQASKDIPAQLVGEVGGADGKLHRSQHKNEWFLKRLGGALKSCGAEPGHWLRLEPETAASTAPTGSVAVVAAAATGSPGPSSAGISTAGPTAGPNGPRTVVAIKVYLQRSSAAPTGEQAAGPQAAAGAAAPGPSAAVIAAGTPAPQVEDAAAGVTTAPRGRHRRRLAARPQVHDAGGSETEAASTGGSSAGGDDSDSEGAGGDSDGGDHDDSGLDSDAGGAGGAGTSVPASVLLRVNRSQLSGPAADVRRVLPSDLRSAAPGCDHKLTLYTRGTDETTKAHAVTMQMQRYTCHFRGASQLLQSLGLTSHHGSCAVRLHSNLRVEADNPQAPAAEHSEDEEEKEEEQLEGLLVPLPRLLWSQVVLVRVRGVPVPFLVALRDIEPGEQPFRDYGKQWWRQQLARLDVLEDHCLSARKVLYGNDVPAVGAAAAGLTAGGGVKDEQPTGPAGATGPTGPGVDAPAPAPAAVAGVNAAAQGPSGSQLRTSNADQGSAPRAQCEDRLATEGGKHGGGGRRRSRDVDDDDGAGGAKLAGANKRRSQEGDSR